MYINRGCFVKVRSSISAKIEPLIGDRFGLLECDTERNNWQERAPVVEGFELASFEEGYRGRGELSWCLAESLGPQTLGRPFRGLSDWPFCVSGLQGRRFVVLA